MLHSLKWQGKNRCVNHDPARSTNGVPVRPHFGALSTISSPSSACRSTINAWFTSSEKARERAPWLVCIGQNSQTWWLRIVFAVSLVAERVQTTFELMNSVEIDTLLLHFYCFPCCKFYNIYFWDFLAFQRMWKKCCDWDIISFGPFTSKPVKMRHIHQPADVYTYYSGNT